MPHADQVKSMSSPPHLTMYMDARYLMLLPGHGPDLGFRYDMDVCAQVLEWPPGFEDTETRLNQEAVQ